MCHSQLKGGIISKATWRTCETDQTDKMGTATEQGPPLCRKADTNVGPATECCEIYLACTLLFADRLLQSCEYPHALNSYLTGFKLKPSSASSFTSHWRASWMRFFTNSACELGRPGTASCSFLKTVKYLLSIWQFLACRQAHCRGNKKERARSVVVLPVLPLLSTGLVCT